MDNMVISNQENFEDIKKKIISEGANKFHVLADFDRPLTYSYSKDGKKIPSLISVLRDGDYISNEYAQKAHELFDKYHPIEIDPEILNEKKKNAMNEWWNTHFDLLIKSGLKMSHLKDIVNSGIVKFREGVPEFVEYLHDKKIPLVVISSSGIGDALQIFFEKYDLLYDTVHIITNLYEWDESGKAKEIKKPIIHGMNKDETVLKDIPKIYEEMKDRKNVLLLGDSPSDLGMITGFDYNNLLKIGFLNEKVEERLDEYKNIYDVVITNDSDFSYVRDFIKLID